MRRFKLLTQYGYDPENWVKGVIYDEEYSYSKIYKMIDLVNQEPEDWEEVFIAGWISVLDQLPEQDQEIFAVDEFEEYHACKYDGYWGFVQDEKKISPTHWMPIPSLSEQ